MDTRIRTVDEPIVPGFRRISWGAVFAGTVVAIMASIVLNLLGVGIGLTTIDPMEEREPMAGLGTGAAIWWVLSSLIALFCGGWVAGRLAGMPGKPEAGIHGVLTWGVSTLVALYLVTTAVGKVIGGAAGFLSGFASTTVQAVASASGGQQGRDQGGGSLLSRAVEEGKEMLRQTGKPQLQPEQIKEEARRAVASATNATEQAAQDPSQTDEALDKALDRILAEGREKTSAVDKEAVANIIAARTGKTKEESMRMVDNWVAGYHQATNQMERVREDVSQEARETGQKVASTLSKASLWAFAAILLSGLVSAAGGWAGRPKEVMVRAETITTTPERPLT